MDDDREHVVPAHEAAVEEGQARRHEVNERAGHQYPGGVARVERHGGLSVFEALERVFGD